MPTALPSDNQQTGFQYRHAWRGLCPHERKVFKFSGQPRPPQASGCKTAPSLQNTMTAKERDMGTRAYAVYMQFLWTARGRDERGAIKILQINYTKKKRQIIYKKSVQGHHFAVIICTNSAKEKKNGIQLFQYSVNKE